MPTPIRSNWLTQSYRWNEPAGRYIAENGRFVTFAAVRSGLEQVVGGTQAEMAGLAGRLQNGSLSVAEWRTAMIEQIKIGQTASAALGRGGWAQMSQSDWGWVGQRCRDQYGYLNRFAEQIATGKQALDGRFLMRVKMYANASRTTFEEMRRRYARLYKGATEERRVLTPGAEHCSGDNGCLELAALGWRPAGELPPIGDSPCLTNCQCIFQMRDAQGIMIGA